MSRPAHWALSPLDLQAHLLLAEGCHPKGGLKARCGHLLPLMTALVLAIVGLVFGFVPLTGFLALILGALAVLFGLLGWARARRGEANNLRMASIGTILGVGAAALGIWGISITFNAVDQFGRDLQDIGQQSAPVSALQDSPQINNFTVRNDGTASFQEQEYVGTSSSRATLMAKVTSISES